MPKITKDRLAVVHSIPSTTEHRPFSLTPSQYGAKHESAISLHQFTTNDYKLVRLEWTFSILSWWRSLRCYSPKVISLLHRVAEPMTLCLRARHVTSAPDAFDKKKNVLSCIVTSDSARGHHTMHKVIGLPSVARI